MPRRYRPDLLNVEGINWKRILQLVAYVEDVRKVDISTDALSTYLESHLDDAICAFQNENPSNFPIEEMKRHLKKLQEYNSRSEW